MDQAIIALIILLVTTVILVKEYIPLGGVGLLLAVSMVLFGILDATSSLVYFSNKTVIQVAVAYIISEAVLVVGVADKIGDLAQSISSKQKDSERTVLILVMVTTALSGLILPRFAVTAALMPIVIAIARSTGVSRTKLLFLLALTANFAGQNTLMSTPPNMLANGILADAGYNTFGYFEFAWIGMPMTIAGVIVVALLQKKILPEYVDEKLIASSEQLGTGLHARKKDIPKYKIIVTIIAFGIFILGIIFEKQTGIAGHVTAILAVALLITTRVLTEKEAFNAVSWSTVFFIVGILSLGKGLEVSGASTLIANTALGFLGENPSPYLLTAVLFIVSATMTQFMSNTGAAGLLFPVGLSIAAAMGADPRAVVMAITCGCGSSFMTPIATPSNTMVMEEAKLKFKDFAIAGTPLMIVTFILVMIILPMVWPFFP